jgi:hypothetical protein
VSHRLPNRLYIPFLVYGAGKKKMNEEQGQKIRILMVEASEPDAATFTV